MIIDTHTHIGVLPPFYMTADMLLGSMERYGIEWFTPKELNPAVCFD